MPPLMGNGEGHSLLILTDDESRLIRFFLMEAAKDEALVSRDGMRPAAASFAAFNAGIARGTAKLAEEFKDEQAARKAKKK